MKFYNQELLDCLPKGARVVDIVKDPTDPKKIRVDYQYQEKIHHVVPVRINLLETLKYQQDYLFHFEEGMTVNFLYELFSTRHNLGLIEGEDYESNDTPVLAPSKLRLPIRPLSLRYQPVDLPITLVDKSELFTGDEKTRHLVDMDINPFKHQLRKQLLKVSTYLIDGREIVCFNKNRLTPAFIQLIIDKVEVFDDTLLDVLRHSTVIGNMNDGLSDVLILSGPSRIQYIIRFLSRPDDLPKR